MRHSADGCPPELREALDSPIPSIRTPFTRDGEMDLDGVRAQVDFAIAGGARTLMLTWGDSLHSLLTDEEVALLAKVVVEHAAGRTRVIAADNGWAINKAVAYGEYCAEIGADLLMLLPPDWASSTTPETVVTHFNAVSEHVPTMLVTAFFNQGGVFAGRSAGFQLAVARALYEGVPGMVAVKDDILGDPGIELCMRTRDRWAVVSGGLMKNHALFVPYGVDGYLCLFMSFKPETAWQYFDAMKSGDFETAWRIIREIERPVMDLLQSSGEGGFNTAVHGLMELFGICQRYLRLPYHTMTDAQLEKLEDSIRRLGLL